MKLTIKQLLASVLLVPILALAGSSLTMISPVFASNDPDGTCNENSIDIGEGVDCARGKGTQQNLFGGQNSLFKTVTNVLLFLIGAVSVIMLIIGGIRYTLSNGDSSQVTAAKNTILYAVIGIIVALLAYAIVNFVVTSFMAGGGNGGN